MDSDTHPFGGRWPRRLSLLGGALILAVLAAALIDYSVTTSNLPELDPTTTGRDPAATERVEARRDYHDRAWLYAVVAVGVMAALVITALRSAPREVRREIFTDLGVAGVAFGVAAAAVVSTEPALFGDVGSSMVWLPAGSLLAAAFMGTALSKPQPSAPSQANGAVDAGPAVWSSATARLREEPRPAVAAMALAALTLLLVVLGNSGRECAEEAPPLADAALFAGAITGLAAAGLGVVALAMRRWVAALVSIPAAALGFLGIALAVAACVS